MRNMPKKLIVYENGDRIVQAPPAWIEYHRTKIIQEYDLTTATKEEIKQLRQNPHDDKLLQDIAKRPKIK